MESIQLNNQLDPINVDTGFFHDTTVFNKHLKAHREIIDEIFHIGKLINVFRVIHVLIRR